MERATESPVVLMLKGLTNLFGSAQPEKRRNVQS